MCLGRKRLDCVNLRYLIEGASRDLSRMAEQDPEKRLKDQPWEVGRGGRKEGSGVPESAAQLGAHCHRFCNFSRLCIPAARWWPWYPPPKKKRKQNERLPMRLVAAKMSIRGQDSIPLLSTDFSKNTRPLLTHKQYSKRNPRRLKK